MELCITSSKCIINVNLLNDEARDMNQVCITLNILIALYYVKFNNYYWSSYVADFTAFAE